MECQVCKYGGFSHNHIGNEIIDESVIVSTESGFKKS